MIDSIKQLFADHRASASTFQLERFVLAASSGGTWWGYYKQALREAHSRLRSLQLGAIELERSRRRLRELEDAARWAGREGRDPNADLDAARLRIEVDDAGHALEELREQLGLLLAHASYAKTKLGDMDEAAKERLEREFWERELCRNALAEALSLRPSSPETWKMLTVLPPEMRDKVARAVTHPNELSLDEFVLEVPRLEPLEIPEAMTRELSC